MKISIKIAFYLLFFLLFLRPNLVSAFSYWDISQTLGLGSADLQITVINIVRWILGLVGLIGVIMILYGGFTWLTSGGNEEKVRKAKGVLTAAVIGLVVVVLSWALVQYSMSILFNVSATPR